MSAFLRAEMILGREALRRLEHAHVVVVGLGAVGSYAVEILARTGVGQLTLMDFDRLSESNLNRQLYALHSTLGEPKAEVAKGRVLDINPGCRVKAICDFAHGDVLGHLEQRPDLVVDAIDSLNPKVSLLEALVRAEIPVVSSMGAARRRDPCGACYGWIGETRVCPLARSVRKALRRRGVSTEIPCVYSTESPAVGEALSAPTEAPGCSRGRERLDMGSLASVTAVFGAMLGQLAIEFLLGVWPSH